MRNVSVNLAVSCLIVGLLSSCGSDVYNECAWQPDISELEISLQVEELHGDLLNTGSHEELHSFIRQHPLIADFFLQRSSYPNDSIMADDLFKRFSNPHIDTLYSEIQRVFGDLSTLKSELNSAFAHLKYYYPEAELPKIQTVATGLIHDMYVSDTLIIIGLDYYLGPGARFRPLNMFNYILKRYAPEYIVPSIMLLYGINPGYNKTDLSDQTVLAEIIAYGKSFYFARQMMPCTPDSVMIWYTSEEMKDVRNNADVVWTHFVENQLLYETSHEVKRKYIEDRPKTYDIGEKAPGRIGTWLGWEIVRAFMEKEKDKTLPELMHTRQPQVIFNASKYRP